MILYYSGFCDKCKSVLSFLHKNEFRDKIKYVCIDSRTKENGKIVIILNNGYKLYLPPVVTKVPTLYDENSHNILVGNDIINFINPPNKQIQNQNTQVNSDPDAYGGILSSNQISSYGVMSDNYSFLEQDANELSAKGSGGMRQMYNYSNLFDNQKINTPNEEDTNEKLGNVNLKQLEAQRNQDVTIPRQPI